MTTPQKTMHDFGSKLTQPSVIEKLKEYVRWQIAIRNEESPEEFINKLQNLGPVSANLDLTSACNFRCYFCVDKKILNNGLSLNYEKLRNSLDLMAEKGLKSVIIMGGGEPTMYPEFEDVVKHIKGLGCSVAILTNGSNMQKISNIGNYLNERDWVRLSLDAGSESTFKAIHNPVKDITLKQICSEVKKIKEQYHSFSIGFSFVITWENEENPETINIDEMIQAAQLAKKSGFDYISFKPILNRNGNYSEVVDIDKNSENFEKIIEKLKNNFAEAKEIETDKFKVVGANNLQGLKQNKIDYTKQPQQCHMQFFRHVLIPSGIFSCSGYRGNEKFKFGDKDGYSSREKFAQTNIQMAKKILAIDASKECDEITCLYHSFNWFVEDLINYPEKLDQLEPSIEIGDYFL